MIENAPTFEFVLSPHLEIDKLFDLLQEIKKCQRQGSPKMA